MTTGFESVRCTRTLRRVQKESAILADVARITRNARRKKVRRQFIHHVILLCALLSGFLVNRVPDALQDAPMYPREPQTIRGGRFAKNFPRVFRRNYFLVSLPKYFPIPRAKLNIRIDEKQPFIILFQEFMRQHVAS